MDAPASLSPLLAVRTLVSCYSQDSKSASASSVLIVDIGERINFVGHVNDVGILETTHDMGDGIGFPNIRQKLVAEPFARRGARTNQRYPQIP